MNAADVHSHLRARRVAVRSAVRVLLVLIWLAPLPLFLQAEPIRDALESSEWYDAGKDDYREYGPEDVPLPEDDWNCQQNREQQRERSNSGMLNAFFNILVYVVVAIAVGAILYLIMRIVQERRLQNDELEVLDLPGAPEHSVLPAEIASAAGVQRGVLDLPGLRTRIEAALAEGDVRMACIYLYLFALLRLAGGGHVQLQSDATARDYVRQLAEAELPAWARDFSAVARYFEYALYRGGLPESLGLDVPQIRAHWQSLSGGLA